MLYNCFYQTIHLDVLCHLVDKASITFCDDPDTWLETQGSDVVVSLELRLRLSRIRNFASNIEWLVFYIKYS